MLRICNVESRRHKQLKDAVHTYLLELGYDDAETEGRVQMTGKACEYGATYFKVDVMSEKGKIAIEVGEDYAFKKKKLKEKGYEYFHIDYDVVKRIRPATYFKLCMVDSDLNAALQKLLDFYNSKEEMHDTQAKKIVRNELLQLTKKDVKDAVEEAIKPYVGLGG